MTPAQRIHYRQAGRCLNCGRRPEHGRTHCERCLVARRQSRQRRYQWLKETRRCVRCLQGAQQGYVYCAACRKRAKAAKEMPLALHLEDAP